MHHHVAFNDLKGSKLLIDTVYEGGNSRNIGDEVLSKLLHVGNSGGFRKCMKVVNGKKTKELAYVCIYSTGEELEWQDQLDRALGRFIYWGDNRKAGNSLTQTKFGGNEFLQEIYSKLALGWRKLIPPVFVFQKYSGRDVIFAGLAVPGDRRMNPQDALVAVWAQNSEGRYQNYKAVFTILDISCIERKWIDDLENGDGYESLYAPKVWKSWIDKGRYNPLITEKNPVLYRKHNEQIPAPQTFEYSLLMRIIDFFSDPYMFEQFACKLVQMMDSNIISIEQTRRTRDGGRDAVGKYRIGLAAGGVEIEFALEAKCYHLNNSVGIKDTARLISRIRHRQFGVFVTTSFIGDQAYKEIVEDQHPIVIVAGKDIVDILISTGINSINGLNEWLDANFNSLTL